MTSNTQTNLETAPSPPKRIYRAAEVCHLVGISRTHLWRLTKAGTFPAPINLGGSAYGWRVAEVEEWIASRPAA